MRLPTVLRVFPVFLAFLIFAAGSGSATAAAKTDLAASINGKNPSSPSLRLKNISGHACQVATTADGTVAITKVVQSGKIVQPLPIDSSGDEDIGYLLQDHLKTLKPGESVSLPLAVYMFSSGSVLRATTWSADAGAFSAEYPIAKTGALRLDASYSLPIAPASGAPACGAVFASGTAGVAWRQWAGIAGMVLLIVAVMLFVWWFWRKHPKQRSKVTTAVVLLMLSCGAVWWRAPLAHADVVVPPELQSTYNNCVSVFNANQDITGPVLRILNDPANHFEIVHTHGVGSDMTGRRQPSGTGGIFRIYWNPDDHHRYAGTGGYPDACTVLYHELYHALDQLNGTFSRDDCAGSGIETKEVMATRAQNLLRVRLGLPARSHYGDRPLPTGDCSASPRPTSCTGEHCAESNGDPHLNTFDGLRYDFQAAGEFVAARSQSGDLEAQVRQEPWTNSKLVAINTAVALKVGSDKVEVQAGQMLTLLVNGKKQALANAKLPGGGQLEYDQQTVIITWPDGSVAYVRSVGMYGVALSLQLADSLTGKVAGLLGDANGDRKNDLHAQGSDKLVEPKFDQLYPKFADSWRITDKSSLFTYGKGKNTESYTNRSFPGKPDNPKNLPGYAAAEAFCKNLGVSDPAILANCALDMAITGRPEFAKAAVRSQTFTAGVDFGGTTWQLNIKNPGDSASVTFDAHAGEKIFVQVPVSGLPSQCGGLRLLGPDKHEVADGCIINGKGEIDGTVLPDTGTYTIVLTPDGPTGNTTVRLLRIQDQQGTITPDGPSVTAKINQPGVVARFTFSGQVGQRVYVDIPSSTLDSQCGGVRLLADDGQQVADGCIINHVGYIDTAILPMTGQYTIVVDPNDTIIGQAQLRLVLPTAESKGISIDGAPIAVNLKKPGSIANLTFSAGAGQRVYVDLPSSELPSQCGLLVLRGPDGAVLGDGCVINHKGGLNEDGIVLPSSGTYTITLDPNAADTGLTMVRARSH
ncbi:MAG TPA: VWD domain-containing protein [Candidatus Saccharimonadales bacterium]|nr:VWD domain-containing protein [Candidatus Saccharimonadales bacterium]